jgi:hypothetical protein
MSFWSGTPGSWSQKSTLSPEQQKLQGNLLQANAGQGAGGSFGASADYYRDLLSNDSDTFNQFQNPELRRFREDIIPDLSEQFAGMGSGGLSSSGFRNAAVNAGTDLSERLGAIRAQLRQQGAAGLMNLGQQGLNPTTQNVYTHGQPGLLQNIGTGVGQGLGMAGGAYLGGGAPGISSLLGKFSGLFGPKGPQGEDRV